MSKIATREALEHGDIEILGLLPGSSNGTFLVDLRRGDETERAVYKPVRGETPLWDFPPGTLAARETAAATLAEALGWPAVPPTVLRDGPAGPGSVQAFVRADLEHHFFTLREERGDDLRAIAAFDVIANNADRKGGHLLLGPDGTIWCIDHGLCFHAEPKLRTVIWDYAGEPVPEALRGDLARIATELRAGTLREGLLGLLSAEEVDATAVRVEGLLEAGAFPEPGPGRAVPWPLV